MTKTTLSVENPTFERGAAMPFPEEHEPKKSSFGKLKYLVVGIGCVAAGFAVGALTMPSAAPASESKEAAATGGAIIFEDTFDGPNLDTSKWDYVPGDGCNYGICGWGNNERESYTSDAKNIFIENGRLKIRVLKDRPEPYPYSSGKIASKVSFKYGVIEAAMKMPAGAQGVWPAFWMLPKTDPNVCAAMTSGCGTYGTWPLSGEIDLIEVANDQRELTSAIHFGRPWPDNTYKKGATTPTTVNNMPLDDAFHLYRAEWTPQEIRWYIDDVLYHTERQWYSRTDTVFNAYPKPFDQEFYLILNVAIGGAGTTFTGNVPENANDIIAKQPTLWVDYIRVRDLTGVAETTTPRCGDGCCDAGEPSSCPGDCIWNPPDSVCGDRVCEESEHPSVCPADC